MKKFLAAAIFLTALFIGCANAEINHADSIYYPQINFYEMTSSGDRIILPHYPTYQQTSEYSCGPAAALTVLHYFGEKNFDEATLIKEMATQPQIGTSLGNMVNFFKSIGWEVRSSLDSPPMDEFEFQKFVLKNLSEGKPIMVENIEWGGHWRVIIGYDSLKTEELGDDVLVFAEPYDTTDAAQDGYSFGSFDRFYSMWFDHYMLPENERNQPWLIAEPK